MNPQVKHITLAPMEGVIDALMRDLLTSINPYDLCVTEFVRVVKGMIPKHVYRKNCPELLNEGRTPAGTPVRVQLLGQHPQWLAENAIRAIEMGSHGIDLNFGCPAPTVNKSKGGATLLKTPEVVYQIIKACRDAVDDNHQVSAKIRLGFDDTSLYCEIIDAIKQSGASSVAIHARTKRQGYKAPAHWSFIKDAVEKLDVPVVANGEIWQADQAHLCLTTAQTDRLMLGRGALATPNLAAAIKGKYSAMTFCELCNFLIHYCNKVPENVKPHYLSSRLKQWLKYIKLQYPQARALFDELKYLHDKQEIIAMLIKHQQANIKKPA